MADSQNAKYNTNYTLALNNKIILDSNSIRKAISYQTFKQLETMLALTGNTINVTEDEHTKDSYRKIN